MAEICWADAHEIEDVTRGLALAAAAPAASQLLLKTPPASLSTLGSRYWRAVGTKLIREYPQLDIIIIVDAGTDAGLAMGAIADGHKAVRFTGPADIAEKLRNIGQQNSCMVIS